MINDLNRTIEKIHNYIYANDGLDNYEVLNEFLKILYIKTFDELNNNELCHYNDDDALFSASINLFNQLIKKHPGLFEKNTSINLKKETLIYSLKELSFYNFTKLSSDVKGHLMQRVINRSFREGRGQFFTPAEVVNFIVDMIDPKITEKGCDPACGTGGFMFSALEHISKKSKKIETAIKNTYFYDISKSVAKIVAMRLMFEFGIDKTNMYIQDSIISSFDQEYDYVLTNPPFGSQGRITDKSILENYILGHNEKGQVLSSQVPDILFVEKVINILKEGGRAAIVLPDGNFENSTCKYFRDFLIKNVKINAIVSLPNGTFIPYGTGVKSSIIFIEKKRVNEDYSIFFGKINNLGYSFSKHSKPMYDKSGKIIEDYSHVLYCYKNKKYDDENFLIKLSELEKHDLNFSYNLHSPKINNQISKQIGKTSILLKDVCVLTTKKIKIDSDREYKYVEISDVNASGCEIINFTTMLGSDLPSRASYKLEENDLIVAVSGNSIGTVWNAKALVTKEYVGCVCTNGFNVVKAKDISPYVLLYFFNSDAYRLQIQKYKYGTAIPTISREDFLNIKFPDYSEEQLKNIEINIKKAFDIRKEINKLLNKTY